MVEQELLDELYKHEGWLLWSQVKKILVKQGSNERSIKRKLTSLSRYKILDVIESPKGRLYRMSNRTRWNYERREQNIGTDVKIEEANV